MKTFFDNVFFFFFFFCCRNGLPRNNTPPNAAFLGPKSTHMNMPGSNHGPRPGQSICIGEEVRIAIHMALDNFCSSEGQKGEIEIVYYISASTH